MNYAEISKETITHLYSAYNSLKNSPLDATIRLIVEIRTSQINGCAYCCKIHTAEARKLNISQEKLDVLPAWNAATIFDEKEVIALQWCEEITKVGKSNSSIKEKLPNYFSEREIVDLTACVAIMTALNKIAIYLKDY